MPASTTAATAPGIESIDGGVLERSTSTFDDWATMEACAYPPTPPLSSTCCADGRVDVEALWERESGYVHRTFLYLYYGR